MGIKGLMPLIQEFAPGAVRELQGPEAYTGRIVAIDASMSLYQFLIAIRGHGREGGPATVLTNSEGEQTSHIQGMFNRTIKLLESGVKPVYVFDGRPPEAKDGELAKRQAKRKEAEEKLKKAQQEGNTEDIEKYSGMLTKVSRKDCEDVKALLRMMGVPVVEAPCEAEAQCGELVKGGKAHAVGTEDMDALTFGFESASPIMNRLHLMMKWVVCFSNLSRFARRRDAAAAQPHLHEEGQGFGQEDPRDHACSCLGGLGADERPIRRLLHSVRLRLLGHDPRRRSEDGFETGERARFHRGDPAQGSESQR